MADELAEETQAINSIFGKNTLQRTEEPDIYIFSIPSPEALPTLRISFPPTYPEAQPQILGTQTSAGGKGQGTRIVQLARDVLAQVYIPGTVVLFDLAEELGQMLSKERERQERSGSELESSEVYLHHHGADGPTEQAQKHEEGKDPGDALQISRIAPEPPSSYLHRAGQKKSGGTTTMYHCILYFHHIYSKNKIRHLHELSQTYNLTGIMKTTRPGFLYAQTLPGTEGGSMTSVKDSLEAFVKEIKQMRWQEVHLKSLGPITEAVPGPGNKASSQGQEVKKRPGFEQVEKMSELGSWMHERQLGDILKEGVGR
ncbi:MAG: hypothetical protein LQ347_006648 [Umbilicaria vellea]|nr:MAG: hypothetical protein LQ347_006648 [Umbilicaria vellea]